MNRNKEFAQLKQRTDVTQAFLVFMAVIGSVERTAAALNVDPEFIAWLAEQEGWVAKIRRVSIMSKSEKPGDWERAQNRALCFVQAHRARLLMDRLIMSLANMNDEDFLSHFKTCARDGREGYSARFFSDLMAALDKAHSMSYAALGDSVGERLEREREDEEATAGQIHAALIAALNAPNVQKLGSQALVDEAASAITAGSKALPERSEVAQVSECSPTEVCQSVSSEGVTS